MAPIESILKYTCLNIKLIKKVVIVLVIILSADILSAYTSKNSSFSVEKHKTIYGLIANSGIVKAGDIKNLSPDTNSVYGITAAMNDKNYWIKKLSKPDVLIMSSERINKYNDEVIKKSPKIYDLDKYSEVIKKSELLGFINFYKIPQKTMYNSQGKEVRKSFYLQVLDNCNLQSIKESNRISYGIVVKKTNLRTFPTEEAVFDSKSIRELDRFQESSAELCEAVIILHTSKDKKWHFIQMYNYRAWVKSEDIAIAKSKSQFTEYINRKNFLIATGNHIKSQIDAKNVPTPQVVFSMGTRIPLADRSIKELNSQVCYRSYVVLLPCKDKKGRLEFKEVLISKAEDVRIGYLPYTRENVIKQAFKMLGDRYDWGGKYNGRDCSSFIVAIYNTFGIKLPRNTYEQENGVGLFHKFSESDSLGKREKILNEVKPGSVIFMKGHEMLYLGSDNGRHYIIHAFTYCGKKSTRGYVAVPVYKIAVTSASLPLPSGIPHIMKCTSVQEIQ